MKTAVISEQGTRPEMEDTYYLDTDFGGRGWTFGGVYDGHGGKYAAVYASENLHRIFQDILLQGLSPEQAFIKSYQQVSDALKKQPSGTTAVNFFIKDNIIYTANAGDARVIIIGKDTTQITKDHRLYDAGERQRIVKMGGEIQYPYVMWDGAGLMPTRTLGDELFKPVGIIAAPSVSEYKILKTDKMLIAACDGLFDFMTNEDITVFARRISEPEPLVELLKDEVLGKRNGTDNLTIIVVSLVR